MVIENRSSPGLNGSWLFCKMVNKADNPRLWSSANQSISKNAFSRIKVEESHFKAFPLDYPIAKAGETVNGGALPPFILTVD